jgi:predicted MFS family arabinose efflux permease
MHRRPSKTGYYFLEGINSFAAAYYFTYLLFHLRDAFGFGDLKNLAATAGFGLIYLVGSWYGGGFAQRHGYFTSLRTGFGGLLAAMMIGAWCPALWGQLLALLVWSWSICFTWPALEALACEHEAPADLPDRIGLYNTVWASAGALAALTGGTLYQALGPLSIYWLPGLTYGGMIVATIPLERRHDAWLAAAGPVVGHDLRHEGTAERARHFRTLAWVANPFSYMAINTLIALVPGIAAHMHLSVAAAGGLLSVWQFVRAVSFVLLWRWPGWHYRFGWFVAAFVLLLASFIGFTFAGAAWHLILVQVVFGLSTGLIYYSSLFYAMDASDTKGAHGGVHEAFIGAGICGGPAVSSATLWLLPQHPAGPTWTVGLFLAAGLAGVFVLRQRTRFGG